LAYISDAESIGESIESIGLHPLLRNQFRKLICDFLLVINTNLAPISHRFRDIAFDRSKIAKFGYTLPKISIAWVGRTKVTDDRR